MAWDDPYDSSLISSIDPRIQSNPYIDEAAGLRIQNEYVDRQRRQQQGGGREQSGKGSWYSQLPEHGWIDRQDKPGSNALGVPDSQQGIALPSKSTLGQWFDVTAPNGETFRLQQTDVGPSTRTGRGIDISAAAAHQMGYTPKDFPTDGGFSWKPANGPPSGAEAAASGSPAGNPQADELGSVAAGRPRMDDPTGIMDTLVQQQQGGRQQQAPGGMPNGLLGAIDPEMMGYLGMMVKALNPYSNIDPNAMLKNAQLQQQHQQDLALRQQQLGLNTRSQDRQDAEVAYKQRELEQSREASKNIYGDASQPGAGLTREGIFKYMQRYPNMDKSTRDFLESRLAAIENQGKITRDIEERRAQGQTQGLEGPALQEFTLTGKVTNPDKPIPAEVSGRLALADSYLKKAPEIAQEIDKGTMTGPVDVTMGRIGIGKQGETLQNMKSGVDALRRMLTGAGMPAAEAAEYVQRYEPTYADTSTSLKKKHERLVEELTGMRDNIMRGRGSSPSPSSQVGGRPAAQSDPLGIR
jgi:hypothetical protein